MRGFVAAAAASAVLLAAPAAQASQRYAAPAGTGTECTQAAPCSLKEAVISAKAGDEVIVGGGTYSLAEPIFSPPVTNVQIHGDTNGPIPRITATLSGPVLFVTQPGDSLSYVEIEDDANGGNAIVCYSSHLERVRVRVVGNGAIAVVAETDCTIRNSLLSVEGVFSTAVRSVPLGVANSTASARNVTAIAAGASSTGASSEYNEAFPGSFTLEIENSIVQGGAQDLKAEAGANGAGNVAIDHSNFDTATPSGAAKVIDRGGNQSAPPLFVDPEGGNYEEAGGSPTIDAGAEGPLGPLDLAGNPRVLGAAPDIGAFEFTPPPKPPEEALPGGVRSISIKPKRFRARPSGGAVISGRKAPVGARVTYTMSGERKVEFSVGRRVVGRKVGGRCHRRTRANAGHKRCVFFVPVKGSFSQLGHLGKNSFGFSGRIGGRALGPGRYALSARAGHLVSAAFTIVR